MGCSNSKLEDQEAISLCRNRTEFISGAIRHRYAVADAHSAYSSSLIYMAGSLHEFLNLASNFTNDASEISLPTQRKGESFRPSSMPSVLGSTNNNNVASTSAAALGGHSHSNSEAGSGGHIEFHSSDSDGVDSDDEDDRSETISHSHFHPEIPAPNLIPAPPNFYNTFQPFSIYNRDYDDQQQNFNLGSSFMNYHYAKNQPPPSTVHFVDPSSSSSINYNTYSNGSSTSYPYNNPTDNYYEFLDNSSSSPANLMLHTSRLEENFSVDPKPPPPPPSPPRVSNWDFLNPFELQENYYPNYTPSRSSRDVRDEEGIPELEDENLEHEVVKEVYGDQKFVGSSSKDYTNNRYGGGVGGNLNPRSSDATETEKDVVEKNVVVDEVPHPQMDKNVASTSKPRSYHNIMEIGSEMRIQFEKASEVALAISKLLEVGKQPYRFRKSSAMEVSSRMICVMLPSASNEEELLNLEDDTETSSKNISSTLHKLYIWEKKLEDEVRVEEKMRLLLDKNRKRQRYLAERGAEQNKIDDVQKLIKKLSTKIKIAIQVIDSISNTINKIRDDELWPQIKELIDSLMKMWEAMLECHQIQSRAISEAKNLDSLAAASHRLNDDHLNIVFNLERDLVKWIGNFSSWINAQKNYVKSLNSWLVLCLHYEPEMTADGVAPYSPGRIGAPPIFVICNSWAQIMDMVSEVDVINAMRGFVTTLKHVWEKHGLDPNHKVVPNGEMDKLMRARERDAQVIHKEINALDKKLELVPGQYGDSDSSTTTNSLQLGLKHIFETMEVFTAKSLKAYEELHLRSEEETLANEAAKLSG